MDDWLKILASVLIGYLLGSINFAIIVSRIVIKRDIREIGSGNAGSTNAYRALGPKIAIFVILGDILKGVAAVLAGWWLFGEEGKIIAGVLTVIGHAFPVYFSFRGGKGILTTAAIMLMIDWRIACLAIAVFAVFVAVTRFISLGSVFAAASLPFLTLYFYIGHDLFPVFMIMNTLFAVLLIFLHRDNIVRLTRREERKFSFRRGDKG